MHRLNKTALRLLSTTASNTSTSTSTKNVFHGVFPIMATAFRGGNGPDKEHLDIASFETAVVTMKQCGASGVTVAGVLGESARLLDYERDQLVAAAVKVAGKMPVIVGTSHSGTHAVVELSKRAKHLGAQAVMVSPTNEAVPQTDKAIFDLYHAVGETGCEIVLQDHPSSTGVHMSLDLIANIANNVLAVKTIKLESPPTPARISQLRGKLREDVTILCGLGGLYGAMELQAGANGFMTGFAFPEILLAMVKAHNAGDVEKRDRIYRRFLPLIVCEQQPGVALRKRLYQLRGMFASGHVRHPSAQLSKDLENTLLTVLASDKGWERVDLKKPLRDCDID